MASWSLAVTGSFRKQAEAYERAHARAATAVTKRAGTTVKNAWRRKLKSAGLGKIEKAIQDRAYPARGASLEPAVLVFSKATTKKRASGFVDLVTVFIEGATIRPLRKRFLLIGARLLGKGLGPKLARALAVKIAPRLSGFDADVQRATERLIPNFNAELERQFAREARR